MGAVSTQKKSNAGKNVLVFFIVFIILEMLIIFGIGKVFKNKDVTPSVAGYSIYMTNQELYKQQEDGSTIVAVPKNVLVIASNGLTDAVGKIGSAVLCEDVSGVGTGVFWLADVNSQDGQDGVTYIISDGYKYYTVASKNIVGFTSSYFQTAGKVISFVTSKFGMIVCAIVPLFFLVLIELIIAIATHSPEEEEDDEDEEEQDTEVRLDDFLFGGQNEGEQIARHRQQLAQKDELVSDNAKIEQSFSEQESVSYSRNDKAGTFDDFDLNFAEKEKKEDERVSSDDTLSLRDDVNMSEYYEKASRLLDESTAEDTAAQPTVQRKPAQRRARPQTQKTARSTSAVSGSASLEDLMKLMEEEQNKLKSKLNQ